MVFALIPMRKIFFALCVTVGLSSCADLTSLSGDYNPGPRTQAQLRAEMERIRHLPSPYTWAAKYGTLVGTQDANGHLHMKPGYEISRETVIEEDENGYLRLDDNHLALTHNGVRINN